MNTINSTVADIINGACNKELYTIIDSMILDEDDPQSHAVGYIMVAHTIGREHEYIGAFKFGKEITITTVSTGDPHMSEKEIFNELLLDMVMDSQQELAKYYKINVTECTNFSHDVCKAFRINSYYIIRFPEGIIE